MKKNTPPEVKVEQNIELGSYTANNLLKPMAKFIVGNATELWNYYYAVFDAKTTAFEFVRILGEFSRREPWHIELKNDKVSVVAVLGGCTLRIAIGNFHDEVTSAFPIESVKYTNSDGEYIHIKVPELHGTIYFSSNVSDSYEAEKRLLDELHIMYSRLAKDKEFLEVSA
ncbi:MAG: hypothetical protein ACK5MU_03920 [Candidatus Saccharimonadales bacterium]